MVRKLTIGIVLLGLLGLAQSGRAFSLIGIAPAAAAGYYSFTVPAGITDQFGGAGPARTTAEYVNMVDPMGFPVDIREFYRWNYPYLTYSFDASFVQFFGEAGMSAVHSAMTVLNDFFSNETRSGVSSMSLYEEYDGLFKTWKFNPTANAASVTDIKSLVLGLMVNHLGLGNPHKHCFVIQDILNLSLDPPFPAIPTSFSGNFQIIMRNFDPYTYLPTEIINGVTHSFTISSDHPFTPLGGNGGNSIVPSVFDAVEYYVSSQNDFSSVAAIRDAFDYGGLPWGVLPWSPPNPTVFRTPGTFFTDEPTDSKFNQPRHTLTFDDAGGLRYLYRTNNLAVETLDVDVVLIAPANMNPGAIAATLLKTANPTPRRHIFGTVNQRATLTAMFGAAAARIVNPSALLLRSDTNSIIRTALRGGIDSIQFLYTPYDSLLNQHYQPVLTDWDDVFLTNALPTDVPAANPPYFSQRIARNIVRPDVLFTALDLGAPAGASSMPIMQMPDTNGWANNAFMNMVTPIGTVPNANAFGPGQILTPFGTNLTFVLTKRSPQYAVQYIGGAGSQATPPNMQPLFAWGWVTNTGPLDYVLFPSASSASQIGGIASSSTPPEIVAIFIDPGASGAATINRTSDRVLIYGNRLDTVTSIDILAGGSPIPTANIPASMYVVSDQLIVLPAGLLNSSTEGTGRRFQLTNSAGATIYQTLFNIDSAVTPIILSSSADGLPWNTRTNLIIRGSGFISAGVPVDRMQIYDGAGALLGRTIFNAQVVVSDNEILIPTDYITSTIYETGSAAVSMSVGDNLVTAVDHFTRQISVGRSATSAYSPLRNVVHGYTAVGIGGSRGDPIPQSLFPNISAVFVNALGTTNWSRGGATALTVRGANLHLAQSIEFLDGDGRLIEVIDQTINPGSPPAPISLRSVVQASALRTGVAIVPSPAGAGIDSYDVQITPAASGWTLVAMFDSASGNNTNALRRAVIRTPFGTATAPISQTITITP